MFFAIKIIDDHVARLERQFAAFGHGVARIDREIQNRVLELGLIDQCLPEARRRFHMDFDRLAEAALQQIEHPDQHAVGVRRLGLESLLPGERKQAVGELDPAHDRIDRPARPVGILRVVLEVVGDQFEIAEDRGQKIIEIVRDTAGQLTDGFHFLRLAQRFLAPMGIRNVRQEADGAAIR